MLLDQLVSELGQIILGPQISLGFRNAVLQVKRDFSPRTAKQELN